MAAGYLLCPQCGSARLYIVDEEGRNIYFHVGFDRVPFPTEASGSNLTGCDFSTIFCCGCSWSGTLRKLVKFL